MSGDIDHHLDEDARLLFKQIEDDRKWRDYQRDVLAPRRAAEAAARQAEAAATNHRLREYARAEHAALVWTGWDALPAEVRRLQQHYVDLALEEPQIDLFWLSRDTRSEELVGKNNAVAFRRSLKVVAPPITGRAAAVDVGHEIGHCRTAHVQGRLQRETAAWRWSKEHCLFWDVTTQATMVRSLQSYTDVAEKVDVLDVLAIEELCSTDEFGASNAGNCRGIQQPNRHGCWSNSRGVNADVASASPPLKCMSAHRPVRSVRPRPATTLRIAQLTSRSHDCAASGIGSVQRARGVSSANDDQVIGREHQQASGRRQ